MKNALVEFTQKQVRTENKDKDGDGRFVSGDVVSLLNYNCVFQSEPSVQNQYSLMKYLGKINANEMDIIS